MASKKMYTLEILLGAKTAANYYSTINRANSGLSSISSSAKKAAALITGAFATVNITGAIKDAVDVYSGYEQSLAKSAAISNATATEYEKMNKAAREAGMTTTKTAEESADALGYMALAGWDVERSTQSLIPVLKLSEATEMDLAETSDLVTDSMSALNLGAKDLTGYLDLVAQENNSANTTSQQLMQAFIKTGGAARTLNMDVQETGVALGILANNGTKAEEGGRSLNAILTRIASNSTALGALEHLDISIFDKKGNFVGFEEALKRINKGLSGLSNEDMVSNLKDIAGTQYYSKLKYLLDGVEEGADGAKSAWDSLEEQLENSEGALDNMDSKMINTTQGAMQILNSAMDDAKISFAESFNGEFVTVLEDLTGGFNVLSKNITEFAKENEIEIHNAFEAIEGGVVAAGKTVGNVAGFIVDHLDLIKAGIAGVGSAMATAKIAGTFVKITRATEAFGQIVGGEVAGKAIPKLVEKIGTLPTSAKLAIGGLALAGGAIAAIGIYAYQSHKNLVKANLEDHFGDISLSLEQLDGIAQDIVGKKKLTKISVMLESIGKTEESIKEMTDSMEKLNQIQWKLNAGFKLDQDDKDSYISSVKDFISSAQDTLDNQGYTVSVATKLLLGSGSKIGEENDAFFSGLDVQMNTLKEKLNKKIEKAVEDGVNIKTDKSIQRLLKKMEKITSGVTESQNKAELQAIDLKYSGKDLDVTTFKQLMKDIETYEDNVTEGAEEAYKNSMAALNYRHETGDLTDKEYNAEAKEVKQGYYNTQAKSLADGSDYLIRSVKDAYPEASEAIDILQENIDQGLSDALKQGISGNELAGTLEDIIDTSMEEADISDSSKDAIYDLFKNGLGGIWSDMEDLEARIKNDDMKVPQALASGVTDMQALSAVSGSVEDVGILVGKTINDSPELTTAFGALKKAGAEMPESVASGIDENSGKVKTAVNDLMNMIDGSYEGKLLVKINADTVASVTGNTGTTAGGGGTPTINQRVGQDLKKAGLLKGLKKLKKQQNPLYRNAKGGIYRNPILTTFAENGAEAAIPLDGSSRAKALWQHAGTMLGMNPTEDTKIYRAVSKSPANDEIIYQSLANAGGAASGGSSGSREVSIVYSPNITIQGNADEMVMTQVVAMSQEKFAQMMEKYTSAKGRVRFGT